MLVLSSFALFDAGIYTIQDDASLDHEPLLAWLFSRFEGEQYKQGELTGHSHFG
jgi:hypothetical protein